MYYLNFILVVIAVGLSDVCWTLYIIKSQQRKAFQAASWATIIIGLSAFTVMSYTHDITLLVAALFGSFMGTYFAVKFSK